jgi:hypothetical protein
VNGEPQTAARPELPRKPDEFNAQWLIEFVHGRGYLQGYQRVRMDRGQHPQLRRGLEVWYEVGYGPLFTVTVRGSNGNTLIITDGNWLGVDWPARIEQFLQDLREV